MSQHQGRHFLQIPGPSPVPDRVLRAMDMPVIDHRSPEFAELGKAMFEGCQKVFKTAGPVIIFPSSGTGAWEAAIVNTLAPGDKVLMAETGQFAVLWRGIAERFKLDVDFIPGNWRHGADLAQIERVIRQGRVQRIDSDRIALDAGEVPIDRGTVFVDCTAYGLCATPPRPTMSAKCSVVGTTSSMVSSPASAS